MWDKEKALIVLSRAQLRPKGQNHRKADFDPM